MGDEGVKNSDGTDISVDDLVPVSACCCCIQSCYCAFPECIGCKVRGMLCCYMMNMACCKVITEANTEGKCCVCWEGGYFCIKPKTCCQEQIQYCCIDYRCALPCTDDVPCLCTLCPFLVLYPKPGCCKTVGALTEKGGEVVPTQLEMH